MNNIGRPNYLSNDKDSLIVVASDIEGDHVLPLDSNYLLDQLQHVIKAVKFWCSNNDVLNNTTPQVFLSSRQVCQ